MAILTFTDTFNTANQSPITGYNGWTQVNGTTSILSNEIVCGNVAGVANAAMHTLSAVPQLPISMTVTGLKPGFGAAAFRQLLYMPIGIRSYSDFVSNTFGGAMFGVYRDQFQQVGNTCVQVWDGANNFITLAAGNSGIAAASDDVLTVVGDIAVDGSGSVQITVTAGTNVGATYTKTWAARTWTGLNGTNIMPYLQTDSGAFLNNYDSLSVSYAATPTDCYTNFSGSNQYVRTSTNFTTVSGTAAMTAMIWYRKTGTPAGSQMLIDVNDSVNATWQLIKDGSINPYRFDIKTTGAEIQSSSVAAATVEDGNWHHLAGTYDGANIKFYLDGVQQGANVAVTGNITSANPTRLAIGARSPGSDLYATGNMKQGRVFSTALTPAQIVTEMASKYAVLPAIFDAILDQSYTVTGTGGYSLVNTNTTFICDVSAYNALFSFGGI